MSERRLARVGAGAGIAYVALAVLGSDVLSNAPNEPSMSATPARLVAYLAAHPNGGRQWAGAYLELLALLALVVFVGHLYTVLRRADRDGGWLAVTALGAGLVAVAVKLGSFAPWFAMHYHPGRLSPGVVAALWSMGGVGFGLDVALTGLLLAATGAVALRTGVLPRWIGWSGLGLAAVQLASVPLFTRSAVPTFLLALIWIAALSVVLVRRAGAVATTAPAQGTAWRTQMLGSQ